MATATRWIVRPEFMALAELAKSSGKMPSSPTLIQATSERVNSHLVISEGASCLSLSRPKPLLSALSNKCRVEHRLTRLVPGPVSMGLFFLSFDSFLPDQADDFDRFCRAFRSEWVSSIKCNVSVLAFKVRLIALKTAAVTFSSIFTRPFLECTCRRGIAIVTETRFGSDKVRGQQTSIDDGHDDFLARMKVRAEALGLSLFCCVLLCSLETEDVENWTRLALFFWPKCETSTRWNGGQKRQRIYLHHHLNVCVHVLLSH